jgi:hypothetical protein
MRSFMRLPARLFDSLWAAIVHLFKSLRAYLQSDPQSPAMHQMQAILTNASAEVTLTS